MKTTLVDDAVCKFEVEWVAVTKDGTAVPFLHLEMKQFNHKIFKEYILPCWAKWLAYFKERGAHCVGAIVEVDNKKAQKFHRMLGMEEAYRDDKHSYSVRWL